MVLPVLGTHASHSAHSARTFQLVDRSKLTEPGYQAFLLLRTVFFLAPVLFGLDKFGNVMTFWPKYLAHWIDAIVPGSAQTDMYVVGAIEIVAGLVVLAAPRLGAWVVSAWLLGIIVNLLTLPGYYDVALRDFGLLVAALALTRLATRYAPTPWFPPSHGHAGTSA